MGYYGLMRVGELTLSPHTVKAKDVHLARNKEKLLIMLYTSKTHGRANKPQEIKITSNRVEKTGNYLHRNFCPLELVDNYIQTRGDYLEDHEEFFVLRDKSPVTPDLVRHTLRLMLDKLSLDSSLYDMHSLRIGRTEDLIRYGYSVAEVKILGRWKSNCVYRYIMNC